jgi:hypothetical protein
MAVLMAVLSAEFQQVQQMGGAVVPGPLPTTAGGAHRIHQAGRELGMGKADWRCGSFGQEGGRIHGILDMAREVGRVGIRMMAVKGLTVGVITELTEQVGTRACTRPGTGRRLEAKLGKQ